MKKSAKKTGVKVTDLDAKNGGRCAISAKAFDDFSSRIKGTLGFDEKACEDGMVMLFNYLFGLDPETGIEDCSEIARIAFMMIRSEVDKAMQRSRAARERAKLRKAKKEVEGSERVEGSDQSDQSDQSDSSDNSANSHNTAKFDNSDSSDRSDWSDPSDPSDCSVAVRCGLRFLQS